MKIVSKECPNCKSNLEFKVGEKDVYCPNCRRKFAVEYDQDVTDPDVALKVKDIQLEILDVAHDMVKSGRKMLPRFIIGYFAVGIIFAIIMIIAFSLAH